MPLFSFVLVSFFLCADTTWWLSWDPHAPPFSPADEATTSRKQLDPLSSQLSHKKEKRKKKEEKNKNTQRRDSHTGTSVIHQHDQDFRTINHHGHHAKCRPQKQHILRADEYFKKCLVCWKERLHAARTFSRSRNPMGGTPYLQMWYVYLIRSSYQWIIQQGYMSQRNKIQQDILGLSTKLHQMTEDNSSWFGNLLGKPWLWIKEIAILLLFLLLAYYLCIHSIKCFFQQMTPASHEEMTVPTRKDYYP